MTEGFPLAFFYIKIAVICHTREGLDGGEPKRIGYKAATQRRSRESGRGSDTKRLREWWEGWGTNGVCEKNKAAKCEERRAAGGGGGKAEFRDAEKRLRKLEGEGELHHLS